jgi:hypothetical protein
MGRAIGVMGAALSLESFVAVGVSSGVVLTVESGSLRTSGTVSPLDSGSVEGVVESDAVMLRNSVRG